MSCCRVSGRMDESPVDAPDATANDEPEPSVGGSC